MTILRTGIGYTGTILVFLLGSCHYGQPPGVDYVAPSREHVGLPARCAHLYNVGRHREWADCMEVGYHE